MASSHSDVLSFSSTALLEPVHASAWEPLMWVVHGVASCQSPGAGQTLLVPRVFPQRDPQKEDLSWRCPKCLLSTTMEGQRIQVAGVCRWLGKPLQKGRHATAGYFADREKALEVEGAGQTSRLLVYLLGFAISVKGSFMLSVA